MLGRVEKVVWDTALSRVAPAEPAGQLEKAQLTGLQLTAEVRVSATIAGCLRNEREVI